MVWKLWVNTRIQMFRGKEWKVDHKDDHVEVQPHEVQLQRQLSRKDSTWGASGRGACRAGRCEPGSALSTEEVLLGHWGPSDVYSEHSTIPETLSDGEGHSRVARPSFNLQTERIEKT